QPSVHSDLLANDLAVPSRRRLPLPGGERDGVRGTGLSLEIIDRNPSPARSAGDLSRRGEVETAAAVEIHHPLVIGSLVQPYVLVAVAVVGAVDHDRHALDVRLPAGRGAGMQDDRPRHVLLELLVDLPDELLALLDVGLHRLFVEELLE